MGILVIREKVTPEQLRDMLEYHGAVDYVKCAIDVELGILAGGGDAHSECEQVMLEEGSEQRYLWGSGWNWRKQEVKFDSLINIRVRDGNRQHELQDPVLRERVREIITGFFAGVEP
jgi:Protein of unknown function (DUF5674)